MVREEHNLISLDDIEMNINVYILQYIVRCDSYIIRSQSNINNQVRSVPGKERFVDISISRSTEKKNSMIRSSMSREMIGVYRMFAASQ